MFMLRRLSKNREPTTEKPFWPAFPKIFVKERNYSPQIFEKPDSKKFPLATASILGQPHRSLILLTLISFNSLAMEKGPNLGKPASPRLIEHWNMDVFPNGEGLPDGEGSATSGKKVYQKHCLSCHGVDGTGDSADELAGAAHSLTDTPPDKTIGTYWPYATTLFDFTRRAMPLNAPGILSNNELYSVTAYLLHLNGIINKDKIINANTLPEIKMPNRNGFINIYNKPK